jgi:ferrous iron transport protein B
MNTIRAIVVGQPNVGKSSLINAIGKSSLHVGNFSGVTVEKKEVTFKRGETHVTLIDLPGLYSLHPYTPEEHVSREFISSQSYDLIVNVIDANALERNLSLTLELLDREKKMIVVVNMIDELIAFGGKIDATKLSEILGVPVMLVSSKTKEGVEEFAQKVVDMHASHVGERTVYYDEKIEQEIEVLQSILSKDDEFKSTSRSLVLDMLEHDSNSYKIVHEHPVFMDFHEEFTKSSHKLCVEFDEPETKDVIAQARKAMARGIIALVSTPKKRDTLSHRIDKFLIHPIAGLPLFLFFMWTLFQLTFSVGSIPMEYIDQAFSNLGEWLGMILPEGIFTTALVDGAVPAIGAIMMFLPNILILFFGINLLEQTGYMARSAFLLDGIMKKFGLQGKAFIPLVSGFGCSVPAYMAARTLKNPKDRLITMLIIGFFSCSARLPVYVLLIGAFFPASMAGNVLFGIYVSGAILGMIMAKILRSVLFKGEAEPFVMEMPRYRLPSLKAVYLDLKIKTMMFIQKAGTFIAVASMVVWFLSSYPINEEKNLSYDIQIENAPTEQLRQDLYNKKLSVALEESYLGYVGKSIEPIFAPMGFDWRLSVATVSALAAKEIAVSTLATLYSVGSSEDHQESFLVKIRELIDFKTAMALIVIIMTYSPCLAAMGTFYAEVKEWQWRVFYTIYPNIVAWLLGYSVYNILGFMGY